jgi:hypothetical protein
MPETFTQAEALRTLQDIGSHKIITKEAADSLGAPFDIVFSEQEFVQTAPSNWPGYKGPIITKGALPWTNGVSTFDIAEAIARTITTKPRETFMGRGFQFQADILAALLVVEP